MIVAANPILIVDDNPVNLKLARISLESEGYDVRTATDGEEAMVILREFRPRLILMDIQLPGVDGLELTRRLKADPATSDIIVVAVTAYAMKGDREKALSAGCDGYITKPIDPIQLPVQIGDYLGRLGDAPVADVAGANPSPIASVPASTASPHKVAGTILVVEDNPTTRKMFRVALASAGYEVLEAGDAGTALEMAARRPPDLIIQDLVLPDMDGLELVRRLRKQLGDTTVPIFCASGFLSKLDEARSMKGGFSWVLVKPVDPILLVDLVKAHLVATPMALGSEQRILVVDDDPLQLKLAQAWLTSSGFDVLTAADGASALELARHEPPHAVLSDVLMPGMDGFALCLALRRDAETQSIPVVLASSSYMEEADRVLAAHVGASALVSKTEGLEAMTRAVAAALQAPPPPAPSDSIGALRDEHTKRALWQLERQVQQNAHLAQRSTLQAAQLAVLAGVAEALARNRVLNGVLGDVLASCLDMAGISKGVLYITETDGRLTLKHQIGFSEAELPRLLRVFDCEDVIRDIARRGRVVPIPSPLVPADLAQRLIIEAGTTSLLLVPVTWGDTIYGATVLGGRTADMTGEDALAFARVLGAQMGQAMGLAHAFASLAASEKRYRMLTENANDAICILTPDGVIREANRRLVEILGHPADRLVGCQLKDFVTPGGMVGDAHGRTPPDELRKADGGVVLVEFSHTSVEVEGERLVLAIGRDVTERKRYEDQLKHQANHDELTGLPNRNLLADRLEQAIAHAAQDGSEVAVLVVDVDNFRVVQDSLGHLAGDQLVLQVAARLLGCVRAVDTVASVGRDFVLVLPDFGADAVVHLLQQRVDSEMARPILLEAKELVVSCSIGISLYPRDGSDGGTLLRNANAAMHETQAGGGNGFRFFTAEMNRRVQERLTLEGELRKALASGELVLHYQPQVDLFSGRIIGAEALVRWRHPQRGTVPPSEFVPIAEETGLIVPMGEWILTEACRQQQAWLAAGLPAGRIGVNLSARQLTDTDLLGLTRRVLDKTGLAPFALEFEVTESMAMRDVDQAVRILGGLNDIGVRASLDDFGTGHSSLRYLKLFSVNALKIDRLFIREVAANPDNAVIVSTIIAMAHNLGLRVIAEGVETEAELAYLHRHHCDEIQGYHFSPPLPADEYEALLREQRTLTVGSSGDASAQRTLLVVDDEPNMLSALSRLLRGDGYRILTAGSAREGLDLLALNAVQVIVSDQRMPGMSGTEFFFRVKQLHPDTVRIVLSGYTELGSVTDAINQGAIYKFLTKPWDDDALRETIKQAFRLHEQGKRSRGTIERLPGPAGQGSADEHV